MRPSALGYLRLSSEQGCVYITTHLLLQLDIPIELDVKLIYIPLIPMSIITLFRPTLLRPILTTSKLSTSCIRRPISVSTRLLLEAGKPQHASTALKVDVREREEMSGASVRVVGEEVKGSEGPHYQGEYLSLC